MKSRLNTYMTFYNITQKELAEGTGINRNTIGRYCNDTFENLPKNHIDALCSFFRVSFESLFETNYNFPIKYPSSVMEQSIKNIAVPQNLVVTKGVDLNTMQERIITYIKPNEFEDPMEGMSPEEIEEVRKISSDYHRRFDSELEVDKLISNFIDKLLNGLFTNLNFEPSVKQIFEKYKGYDYFTTNIKVEKFYDAFHRFLKHYSNKDNAKFIKFLDDIQHIYENGGLGKLTDNELEKLKDTAEFLNNEDKQKD